MDVVIQPRVKQCVTAMTWGERKPPCASSGASATRPVAPRASHTRPAAKCSPGNANGGAWSREPTGMPPGCGAAGRGIGGAVAATSVSLRPCCLFVNIYSVSNMILTNYLQKLGLWHGTGPLGDRPLRFGARRDAAGVAPRAEAP